MITAHRPSHGHMVDSRCLRYSALHTNTRKEPRWHGRCNGSCTLAVRRGELSGKHEPMFRLLLCLTRAGRDVVTRSTSMLILRVLVWTAKHEMQSEMKTRAEVLKSTKFHFTPRTNTNTWSICDEC